MAEDTRSTKDRFVEESIGMIKDSLRVNRDTKGFGNIMKETFSPANFFGADSKMGKMFSSTEERDRIRGYGGGKQKGSANTSQEVGVSPELKQIQADVADIKAIQEESKSDPEFRELDKSGKDQLSVSKQILATLRKQEPAMTKMQGDSVIALLKKGVGSGGGGGGESDSGPGFFSGALATGIMMKGKDLFAAGKNKAGSLMKGAKSAGGSLLRGAGGVARGLGGAGLGVGLGAYEAVSGAMGAERDLEGLEISAEEAQSRKGEAIGSGAGGAGGALAGAAVGAAVGSAIPVVGTLIGGIVGGAIGYFAGSAAGGAAGEAIADAIPVSEEDLKESNTLANEYLDKIADNPGGDELVAKIKSEATEIESMMMESTGKQPEELSENDIDAIANAALVKAIQNNQEEAETIGVNIDTFTASYSSDNPMQMGPGDVKEYDTRLEEINNSDMSESIKIAKKKRLDAEFGAKFGGTPQQLEARKAMANEQSMRETREQSGSLVHANMSREQKRAFDEEVQNRTQQYREEFIQKNEGKEKSDSMYNRKLNTQNARARKDVTMEILNTGGVLGDKEALIEQGVIEGDFATGNVDRSYEIDGEEVSREEYEAQQDRMNTGLLDDPSEMVVDAGEPVPIEEIEAAYEAGKAGEDGSLGSPEDRAKFYERLASDPNATPDQVISLNQKARQAREQAEINTDIEAGYGEGLSGNTNASVVENATDDANNATAPGATAPVVVQAPAPAPQPQPDINVVVSMPKTIGPETRSGVRMIGMLGNDY